MALVNDHKITEAELKEAGIPTTVMRNSVYSDIYIPVIVRALKKGAYVGSVGEGRPASASRADPAEALSIVATSEPSQGIRCLSWPATMPGR